jgi:hypothetical protein
MKSFKEYLEEKRELGPGSRVIVDQSRYRSGRDPGRKLERLTGTIRKIGEDGAHVDFDRHISVKGKKVKGMRMNMKYVSELVESNLFPDGNMEIAAFKYPRTEALNPTAKFTPKGKGQQLVMSFLSAPGRDPRATFELSSVAEDKQVRKEIGIVHFGKIVSAANALAKKGAIQFDGISKVSLEAPQTPSKLGKNLDRMTINI